MTATAKTSAPKNEKKATKAALKIAKGTDKPASSYPSGKPEAKRLPKSQIRILTALSKAPEKRLSVAKLAEKSGVPATHMSGFTFLATKAKKSPALAELGYVRERFIEVEGHKTRTAELTASGAKVLAKLTA